METKRRTRVQNATIYLGTDDERKRRLAALDALAERVGVKRSVLIQKIADGELTVTPAAPCDRTRASA